MILELINGKDGRVTYTPRAGRISYSAVPSSVEGARNPIAQVQHIQQFLDLSCFAERWWQETLAAAPDTLPDSGSVPWRPIWAARNLEFDPTTLNPEWHYAGANQVCLVCDTDVDEPYTLCDTCGEAMTRLYLQRYGVDLH